MAAVLFIPVAGIPRILRPRKKQGTVTGFTVVDPGGNWLRVYKLGDTEEDAAQEKTEGLAQILKVAARLGDAHGDEAMALKTLENGLKRFPDAAAVDRVKAYLYQAELAIRTNNVALAQSSLALAYSIELTDAERAVLAEEIEHAAALIREWDAP